MQVNIGKRNVLTFLLASAVIVYFFHPLVQAQPSNNPIFATIDEVKQIIDDSLSPIQSEISNINSRLTDDENKIIAQSSQISQLQIDTATEAARMSMLESRVIALENKVFPPALLFDDFSGPTLNTNLWEFFSTNGGSYSFDNGSIVVPGGSSMFYVRSKSNPFPTSGPFTTEFGIKYTSVDQSGDGVALGFNQQNGYDPSNVPIAFWQGNNFGLQAVSFGLTQSVIGSNPDLGNHVGKISYDGTKYLVFLDGVLKYTSPPMATSTSLWFGNPFCCRTNWTGFKLDYIKVTSP